MAKVYVTRSFPGEGMQRLKEHFEVVVHEGWNAVPREEFLRELQDTDILLTYNDVVDREMIENAPRLKAIIDHWGGHCVDRQAAGEAGIAVPELPDNYGWIVDGVADLVWGMMIAAGRRFREGGSFIRRGCWSHSEQSNHLLLGQGLSGRTVGILGAGTIGRAVARRAAGFGVNLIYYDIVRNAEIESMGAVYKDRESFFREADYLTVHLSDIDENVHFIGEKEFAMMKETAVLVNTARGRMIDEKAMVQALLLKQISAAALEVFESEPRVSQELLHMENVILIPHAGGALRREREAVFSRMADECLRLEL